MREYFRLFLGIVPILILGACSTNPATGQQQFTALMSPEQEKNIGNEEHRKVIQQFGQYANESLQDYVDYIGQRVASKTERQNVNYHYTLLDSPMVNAFALPGGYVYITRGLLALANSEAEIASVLAHETGHITGRHAAERYSRGVVTSLGASILASAIGETGVSDLLGVGTDLYIKSYSREQENQADRLGIRYISAAGYDPRAMAVFLSNLQRDSALEAKLSGKQTTDSMDYFSTHPATAQRVEYALQEASLYPKVGTIDQEKYLRKISGITYGDSDEQGFVRGNVFYHTKLGFKLDAPEGYTIVNQADQILALSNDGAIMVFDFVENSQQLEITQFLSNILLNGKSDASRVERITINQMAAGTASFRGTVNNHPMMIRLIAIRWSPTQVARFQLAIPENLPPYRLDTLKAATYSFRPLTSSEKYSIKPYRLIVISATSKDTVQSLAQKMPFPNFKEERFRVLNGMNAAENIVTGRLYKIVVE